MKYAKKNFKENYNKIIDRLNQLEEYYDLLKVLPDIVYKTDKNGILVYVNYSVGILGFSPEELIGKHFSIIIHPDDVDFVCRDKVLPGYIGRETGVYEDAPKLFDERRTGRRMTKNLIVRLRTKDMIVEDGTNNFFDNKDVYGEIFANGLYYIKEELSDSNSMESYEKLHVIIDEDGLKKDNIKKEFQGTVGIIRNITERKNLEFQKEKLKEELYRAKKLEAVGQLAGGIAHTFNNILSAISGYAEMINYKFTKNDLRLKKYVKMIISAANRASDLTNSLLAFTHKGKRRNVEVNIRRVISDVIGLLQQSLNKNILINKKYDIKNSSVHGDPDMIHNAIMNIALNAVEAMPNGGEMFFSIEDVFLEDRLLNSDNKEQGLTEYILISVRDTGIGMDEAVKARIFEPFFSTKSPDKGIGLGLASAYGIVKDHRGFIEVESRKEFWTNVKVYLPVLKKEKK